ncbi:MAG: methyltransferase [Bacteroidetes bacterium]|nr:methyltransferase [Bacteroidota bacterium]
MVKASMANDFFDFQQFRIHQARNAMKVTSEACLFGAWYAAKAMKAERMLDIGAGTGLLMLMLAQKHGCPIDGIEIDLDAASECRENLNASPWWDRLELYEGDVVRWEPGVRFDCIISNPPFYERSLLRADRRMNDAMHSTSLNLDGLAAAIGRLSSQQGQCSILLPMDKSKVFEARLQSFGFETERRVLVCHRRSQRPMRQILCMSRGWQGISQEEELFIDEPGQILSEYYLSR